MRFDGQAGREFVIAGRLNADGLSLEDAGLCLGPAFAGVECELVLVGVEDRLVQGFDFCFDGAERSVEADDCFEDGLGFLQIPGVLVFPGDRRCTAEKRILQFLRQIPAGSRTFGGRSSFENVVI